LQMNPRAKGLFARAVGMSGSPFGGLLGPVSLAKAEEQGLEFQQELGAASLDDLRALPGDKVSAAATVRGAIVVDGRNVTGSAEEVFAARQQNDVPVLIGYTRDESFRPLPPSRETADLTEAVRTRFADQAPAILAAYDGVPPPRAALDIARDASVGRQMADWASYQQRYGSAPAFGYQFARRHPYAPGITFSDHDPATVGAYHTGDVPYWLRTRESLNLFRTTRVWEPADLGLETEMSAALLSFARTGQPSSPTVGPWPAFDARAPQLVWLAETSRVIDWPHFGDFRLLGQSREEARQPGARPRD